MDTLLDLSGELEAVEREIIAAHGEVTPELNSRFEAACKALVEKTDAFAIYCRNLTDRAGALRKFAADLIDRAKIMENHEERLLKYADVVIGDERSKLEGEMFTLARVKNPGRVEILDEAALTAYCPEAVRWSEFTKPHRIVDGRVETPSIDKTVVRDVLKRQGHLPGASLIEGHRIAIR